MVVIKKKKISISRADQVRNEAQRRMIINFGARDKNHLDILISNSTREAIKLLRKGENNWSIEDSSRAAQLEAGENLLDLIREKSNALESMDPIPDNFTDDVYWS